MKRIAAYIGLTTFCALAVAFYLPQTAAIIVMVCFAVAAVLLALFKRTRRTVFLPVIAATAALAIGVNLCYTAFAVRPVTERFSGSDREIEATLTDESFRSYRMYCYPLETVTIDGEPIKTKLLLKSYMPIDAEPFQKLSFTADITPTENSYYLAKGYSLSVSSLDLRCSVSDDGSRPLYYYAICLREKMREAINAYLPKEEAALCCALLLGDKYALSQEVREDFRYSGVSYFVVVSGIHCSILFMIGFAVFKCLFRKRFLFFPLTYLMILVYMAVTGFQPSVMRSGIMMLVLVTGKLIRRQYDVLTSLGVAGLAAPLIFSPYGCGDIGMILSFAATLSIILWQEPIYEKLRIKREAEHRLSKALIRAVNLLLTLLSVSLSALILVLPITVWFFKSFSLMTLTASLILFPVIWFMLPATLLICVLHYLTPLRFIALFLSWPLYGAARLTLLLVRLLSNASFAYIHIKSAFFPIWLTATVFLGILAYYLPKRFRFTVYAVLLSAILFCGGVIVNIGVQLHTDELSLTAGKQGAAVRLDRHGSLYLLRFDCNSTSAYQMLMQMKDDYGGARCAVCATRRERQNYHRMSDREFPVEQYLVYQRRQEEAELPTDEILRGRMALLLDDGLVLQTAEDKGRLLLYLTDGDTDVLMIPSGYSFDAIPKSMRSADLILLDHSGEDYDRLTCRTLIRRDNSPAKAGQAFPQNENSLILSEETVRIKLN